MGKEREKEPKRQRREVGPKIFPAREKNCQSKSNGQKWWVKWQMKVVHCGRMFRRPQMRRMPLFARERFNPSSRRSQSLTRNWLPLNYACSGRALWWKSGDHFCFTGRTLGLLEVEALITWSNRSVSSRRGRSRRSWAQGRCGLWLLEWWRCGWSRYLIRRWCHGGVL